MEESEGDNFPLPLLCLRFGGSVVFGVSDYPLTLYVETVPQTEKSQVTRFEN